VVIVNQALVDRHWSGEDPVGRRISFGSRQPVSAQVVGVVGDVLYRGLDLSPRPELYVPHAQSPGGGVILAASTRLDAAAQMPELRAAVWKVDPTLTFYIDAPLERLVERSVADRRFYMSLLTGFAAVALALAAIGIYGLLSYAFQARGREIALRVTLGASRADVFSLVLGSAAALSAAGVALGLGAAFATTRLLSGMLYGVTALDPLTFAGASLGVVLLSLVAAAGPARRATALDPATVLRE
jgi:putative ABC transport system permease protein